MPEVRQFLCQGLQQFEAKEKYDCIWVQWCLCYLTDEDCLTFLERARDSLTECPDKPGRAGLLFVKENVEAGQFLIDKSDHSIMRTEKHFSAIFEEAGFTVLTQFYQRGFP